MRNDQCYVTACIINYRQAVATATRVAIFLLIVSRWKAGCVARDRFARFVFRPAVSGIVFERYSRGIHASENNKRWSAEFYIGTQTGECF